MMYQLLVTLSLMLRRTSLNHVPVISNIIPEVEEGVTAMEVIYLEPGA